MRHALILLMLLTALPTAAQTRVEGRVRDGHGAAVVGANIWCVGSYDGASTDTLGRYAFVTDLRGARTLVVSAVGYQTDSTGVTLNGDTLRHAVELREDVGRMAGVVVTAGTFGAGDDRRAVLLRPLDVVMTAGSAGDLVTALSTLPGAQRVGESGELFVRGGAGRETQAYVDGLWAPTLYQSTLPAQPARGRFSPFMFKGTTFSTG
ncbi:MAG: carboxypeptidase-like regulatory domain-containing protein, partial [Catalinimonas sp.]